MISIMPKRETIPVVPNADITANSAILAIPYQRTIATGSPGGTLAGVGTTNGATASSATAYTMVVSKATAAAPSTFVTLATLTWAADQAAYTGVYETITPATASTPTAANNLARSTMGNNFSPGDILKCEVTTAATDATTGFLHLDWE